MTVLAKLLSLVWVALYPQLWPYPGPGVSGAGVPSLYYGYGCTGSATNSCTVGGTSQTGTTANAQGYAITTGSNAAGYSVLACGGYFSAVDATNKLGACAIYSGAGPTMSLVCAATSTMTLSVGWNENTAFAAGCNLAASSPYFVAWQVNGTGTAWVYNTTAASIYGFYSNTFNTWLASKTWTTTHAQYSVYMRTKAN